MKRNKIIINIILTSIVFLTILIVNNFKNNEVSLREVTLIGIIVNIFCIFSCYSLEKKFSSPYMLFQIFSLIFLYGYLFCKELVQYNPKDFFDLTILVSTTSLKNACFLIMYCQIMLHLGFLCYSKKENNNSFFIENDINYNNQIISLKKVGIILLVISIIPAFYEFYINLTLAIKNGYMGLSENRMYGILSFGNKLIPFFKLSLMILMVSYKQNKRISLGILCFSLVFYGSQMFFGNRGIPLITVITFIWLYNLTIKHIGKNIIICVLVIIIPVSSILNIIRHVRDNNGIRDWISNFDTLILENINDNNPIFETLYEIGTTIFPISYTIENIPEKVPFKYGKLYLLSFLSTISVNSTEQKNDLAFNMNIAAQMSELSGSGFGGSFIQEAYANFGWYCPIFMFFLGIALAMLERKIQNSKLIIDFVLIAYFLNPVLWTIRNVIITLPREIVWYILPTYLLYYLIYNRMLRMEKINEKGQFKNFSNNVNI